MDLLIIILSSSVIATFVSSMFMKSRSDKSARLQYITNERKLWRDDIRKATVALRKLYEIKKEGKNPNLDNCSTDYTTDNKSSENELEFQSYKEAKAFFQIRLHPGDTEDDKLLGFFDDLDDDKKNDEPLKQIEGAVAILLKFDWERAKYEVKPSLLSIWIKILLSLLTVYKLKNPILITLKNIIYFTDNSQLFLSNIINLAIISALSYILITLVSKFILFLLWEMHFTEKYSKVLKFFNIPIRQKIENDKKCKTKMCRKIIYSLIKIANSLCKKKASAISKKKNNDREQ